TRIRSFVSRIFFSNSGPDRVGMDFARVVRKRRMIRAFKPVPVPEDKIRRILELAQHYPSAGFSQGVAFIVITEPAKVRRLRELSSLRRDTPILAVAC